MFLDGMSLGSVSNVNLFDRYGSIRQIRMGNAPDTRGTAFVGNI